MKPMTPMKATSLGLIRSEMEFSSPKCAPAFAATKLLGAQPSSVATCFGSVCVCIYVCMCVNVCTA